jgi:hypothetical protein
MEGCKDDCCRPGSLTCHHRYRRRDGKGTFAHKQGVWRHKHQVDSKPHLLCQGLYGPQNCHGCSLAPPTARQWYFALLYL